MNWEHFWRTRVGVLAYYALIAVGLYIIYLILNTEFIAGVFSDPLARFLFSIEIIVICIGGACCVKAYWPIFKERLKKTNNPEHKVEKNMSNFMTVVFEYEEGAKLPSKLTKSFAENVNFEDVKITAISLEDEIGRVEELEKILDKREI